MNLKNRRREFPGLAPAALTSANALPTRVLAQSAVDRPALLGGTIGDLGCFSVQNSKHLPSGEGAITGNSDDLIDRASSFHDCGRPYGGFKGTRPNFTRGGNFRMPHYQAATTQHLLLAGSADIDHIGAAIRKIQSHGAELAKA
jgi:hypothetical protein